MVPLNATRIISQWAAEQHPLTQPRSLPDTQWILDSLLGTTYVRELTLSVAEAKYAAEGLFEYRQAIERPITRREARNRINRLLQHMNCLPGVSTELIPEPTLIHRPTALPSNPRAFAAATQMCALDRQLLTWCRQEDTLDGWILVLAIRLMTRLGLSERVTLGTLTQLTHQHISRGSLAIPSSPDVIWPHGGYYRISLPADVWVPLRAIMTREKRRPATDWLLASNADSLLLNNKERRQELRQRIIIVARRMLSMLSRREAQTTKNYLKSWSSITNASRHVPVLRGVPPLWSTLLREYPLPTCTPMPLRLGQDDAHKFSPGHPLGRLPDRQNYEGLPDDPTVETFKPETVNACHKPTIKNFDSKSNTNTRPAGVRVINVGDLPIDWRRRSKNILQQFLAAVSRLSGKKHVKAKKLNKPMQEHLVKYQEMLYRVMGFSGHYPAWVMHFIYHQLRTEGNTISTAKTQLSRLTPFTLFLHDAVMDLGDWDDEVVLELEMAAKSGSHWKPATLDAFRGTFRQFIKFCHRHGILEDVTLPKNSTENAASILRTRILSPDHMDHAWDTLTQNKPEGAPNQMTALVIALGFYGGLRASEVESLTLKDIQVIATDNTDHVTCWINILGGKTAAARRRVALHAVAPPSVVEKLCDWISLRRMESLNQPLACIALFGPRHSAEGYTRRYLITLAIVKMRELLGEDIDFHGLRHAAVSWMLLRLHAAQSPGFVATLQHRHHWMFQPAQLRHTLEFFCGAEGNDTLSRGSLLLHVAKWIGHRDPGTLLETYAHTLGLIHSDILAPK